MKQAIVIAIDGPAGAGKSSVASAVAARMGLARLDTGSMYRALTWRALGEGIDLRDGDALAELAENLGITFTPEGIAVDAVNRESEIRTPQVTAAVSTVSGHPKVRHVMVRRQQELARAGGAVIEGRDIGSVVAPWANVKIFLTASPAERGRRRHADFRAAGHDVPIATLVEEILARDERDSRTTPLVPAEGAVVVDSTGRTMDEVVAEIEHLTKLAIGASNEPASPDGES